MTDLKPSPARFRRAAAVALAVLVCLIAPVAHPARTAPAKGKFLVASRDLGDPNFSRTVVLLLGYGPEGALGLVINRPTQVPLSEALPGITELEGHTGRLFLGGPVSTESMRMLVRAAASPEGSQRILADIHVSESLDLLRRMAGADKDGATHRLFMGYAGWGAGQLDGEIEAGGWHVLEGDPELVLSRDPSTIWERLVPAPPSLRALIVPRTSRSGW